MKRPSKILESLIEVAPIQTIHIEQIPTGNDTADTMVVINNKLKGKWSTYEPYLDVGVNFNSIASIKKEHTETFSKWLAFKRENEKDLKEYNRLKEKLAIN